MSSCCRLPACAGRPWTTKGSRRALEPVEGTEFDFRVARRIGSTKLDTGYADLERDEAGLAHVKLTHPGTGLPFVFGWMPPISF